MFILGPRAPVARPGRFEVEILQGCGLRNGGSEVEIAVAEQTLSATVEESGGFQKFAARKIGTVNIARPGKYTLSVKPSTKPGRAVMDLRRMRLLPESK